MLRIAKIIKNQGYQTIPDILDAEIIAPYRGFPCIRDASCGSCTACVTICPVDAIKNNPISVDMGKCVFCGDCERVCADKIISFSNFYKTASTNRGSLIVNSTIQPDNYLVKDDFAKKIVRTIFKRSLKLRQVSAAGCNGCELELNACSNVNFDMSRFGIDIVASPRHADGIIITGPISENMKKAVEDAYLSTPEPRLIIVAGSCAISGGIFQKSKALNREFFNKYPVDLFIPGCPIHPLAVVNGIIQLLK